jgi:hypothetical protein
MYEDHCRQNGQPANHAMAKELLAGFAAAEVDRLIETKVHTLENRADKSRVLIRLIVRRVSMRCWPSDV